MTSTALALHQNNTMYLSQNMNSRHMSQDLVGINIGLKRGLDHLLAVLFCQMVY